MHIKRNCLKGFFLNLYLCFNQFFIPDAYVHMYLHNHVCYQNCGRNIKFCTKVKNIEVTVKNKVIYVKREEWWRRVVTLSGVSVLHSHNPSQVAK